MHTRYVANGDYITMNCKKCMHKNFALILRTELFFLVCWIPVSVAHLLICPKGKNCNN